MIYSLVLTCRACGVEPYAWLRHVLTELPLRPPDADIEDLMPFNFAERASQPKHLLTLESSPFNAPIPAHRAQHHTPASSARHRVHRKSRLQWIILAAALTAAARELEAWTFGILAVPLAIMMHGKLLMDFGEGCPHRPAAKGRVGISRVCDGPISPQHEMLRHSISLPSGLFRLVNILRLSRVDGELQTT